MTSQDNHPTGRDLLRTPRLNKGTAFTREERDHYGLRGLLPHMSAEQDIQVRRILGHVRRKEADIERYIALNALQDRNERLYYRTLIEHIDELMPIVYTPTVGQACREFAQIYRQAKGLYITPDDRGHIRRMLDNWPEDDVRVIVVTDGERILGLGDLGANGMGIPIGKLALYVACAGVRPEWCMPVMLDVGTENRDLLEDPLYMGYPHRRIRGDAYFELVEEFVDAVNDRYPGVLIQFEDFLTPRAYALLQKYRHRVLSFNDDIQGTAAVTLAGVYASTRISGTAFRDLRILFVGAGSASTGIGQLLASALQEEGIQRDEALRRLWFVDSRGLVVSGRDEIAEHKRDFAHDHEPMDLHEAVEEIRPHILIGATGVPRTFPKKTVRLMAEINERPGIFALSNPTSQAECTAEQAYAWTDGRALFASGSPFPAVERDGQRFEPAQGNNAYVFPGIGLGAVAAQARHVPDSMFMAAARALAESVSEADLERGALYPGLADIRRVSLNVAEAVARVAWEEGETDMKRPDDIRAMIAGLMYDPTY
ncbi:MAG: NAD-dependent malic enzyme [Rhodothermales bacterium]|nr:NAD-dependent malic enzyme [Rhodothermales bacterium]